MRFLEIRESLRGFVLPAEGDQGLDRDGLALLDQRSVRIFAAMTLCGVERLGRLAPGQRRARDVQEGSFGRESPRGGDRRRLRRWHGGGRNSGGWKVRDRDG